MPKRTHEELKKIALKRPGVKKKYDALTIIIKKTNGMVYECNEEERTKMMKILTGTRNINPNFQDIQFIEIEYEEKDDQ